jgi:hypothetical protein
MAEDLALSSLVVASDCKGMVMDIAEGTLGSSASLRRSKRGVQISEVLLCP